MEEYKLAANALLILSSLVIAVALVIIAYRCVLKPTQQSTKTNK